MSSATAIEGKLSCQRIEKYLARIRDDSSANLRIPLRPKTTGIGCDTALAQLVITWAQSHPDGELELYLDDDSATATDQLRLFVKKPPGLAAASMTRRITNSRGISYEKTAREEVRHRVKQYWRQSETSQQTLWETEDNEWTEDTIPPMGPRAFLPCIDHMTRWTLPQLYHSDGTLRSRPDVSFLTEQLLRRITTNQADRLGRNLPFSPDLVKGLASVVYELFDNTHRWARSDATGAMLDRS